MKLIGDLKKQAETESTREGRKILIEKAGMKLTDDDSPHNFKTAISSSPSISPVSVKPNELYSFRAASFSGSYDSQQYSAAPQGSVDIYSRASLRASLP